MEPARCLVVDPHPLVRLGVRQALGDDFEVEETASREEALGLVRDIGSIDVAVLDLGRRAQEVDGELGGTEAIRELRKAAPVLGIVAHGNQPDRHFASSAMQAGASAYIGRTAGAAEMLRAVRAAIELETFVDPAVPPKGSRGKLTRRQRQILQLLADGGTTTVAARRLGVSEETVKTHTKHALARLGARNRTHAVAIALRECLIE